MYSTDAIVYYMYSYLFVYVSDIFPSEMIITKSMNKLSLRPQRDESVELTSDWASPISVISF